MVVLFVLALMATEAPDPSTLGPDAPKETEPPLARFGMAIFALCQPLALAAGPFYWILFPPNPVPDILAGTAPPPDYLEVFVHGIDWLLMLLSLFAGRLPYSCSRAGWVVAYGFLYILYTYVHQALELGSPRPSCADPTETDLSKCPLYTVLDWNDPAGTLPLAIIAPVAGAIILPPVYIFLVMVRDAMDKKADLAELDRRAEEAERQKLLAITAPPPAKTTCCFACA